ncbi:MAG: hypothetical protein R3B09_13530 [Nannocystaceae bacterium]
MRPSPSISTRAAALLRRWCVAYLLLRALPFPLDVFPLDPIPGVRAGLHALLAPWRGLVGWVGGSLFGVAVDPRRGAVLDSASAYVEAACVAALALVIALAAPRRTGALDLSSRAFDRARAYAALALGARLLPYGWQKLIPTQMPEPGPDRLIIPYGDMSPMGVLWTFMGTSPGYEALTGLIEVLAATLLFWRRTRLLGAALATLALAHVVALNFGYDVALKVSSLHLLALALFVLSAERRRLLAVLLLAPTIPPREPDPPPSARPWRRWSAWGLKLALLLAISLRNVVACVDFLSTRGSLAPASPLHGVYRVDAFTRGGVAELADDRRWLRVGLNRAGTAAIQRADGHGIRYGLTIDAPRGALTFTPAAGGEAFVLRFTATLDGGLRLAGVVDGAHTIATLSREPEVRSPAKVRFRWVVDGFVNH